MTLRGEAAIIGIGELPTRRAYPGRSQLGLFSEVSRLAIADAGLRKEDIDGLVTEGGNVVPGYVAEYLGIKPVFATGVTMMGASATSAVTVAASAVSAGLCNYVLIVMGSARSGEEPPRGALGAAAPGVTTEWESPYGPAVAANNGYGLLYRRHMHEFGTKPEQLAKLAVDQRFNALNNPNSAFQGRPITIDDVLNSRYINEPLHILECVMPCAGAAACIVTTAERAKAAPHPGVYVLGSGMEQNAETFWQKERMTISPAAVSVPRALTMAGYGIRDMEFAEFYD